MWQYLQRISPCDPYFSFSLANYPDPEITGTPTDPVSPGSPVKLTCTWPNYDDQARLVWIDPHTDLEVPQSSPMTIEGGNKVIRAVFTAKRGDVQECQVVGSRSSKPLVDRDAIPVIRPLAAPLLGKT